MKTKNELHSGIEAAAIWPRRTVKRHWLSNLLVVLAGAALLLVLSGTPSVHAASITVDGTICTLADAIEAANTDLPVGGCIAGDVGSDTIDLQTNVTLSAALPVISSNIVLQGNNNTIDGNGGFRVLQLDSAGNLTLNSATITGGFAEFAEGGGIFNDGGTVTINNSTITNNAADSFGGGIRNTEGGDLTLNNSTISGNSSNNDGGGINSDGNTLTLNNVTIADNSANGWGGGIGVGAGTTTLNRSIVSGNTASSGANEVFVFSGTVNGNNYNLFGNSSETSSEAFDGTSGGGENFTPGATDITATSDGATPTALTSILDVNLANNGTQPHTDTHALVAGSPAIDVIPTTDASCVPGTTVDQRGGARANGVDQGGAACDIGAFEYDSFQTPTAVTISGLGAQAGGTVGLAVAGAVGILALLSGGVLTRRLRRKSAGGD
jgi:hypothetical protein